MLTRSSEQQKRKQTFLYSFFSFQNNPYLWIRQNFNISVYLRRGVGRGASADFALVARGGVEKMEQAEEELSICCQDVRKVRR